MVALLLLFQCPPCLSSVLNLGKSFLFPKGRDKCHVLRGAFSPFSGRGCVYHSSSDSPSIPRMSLVAPVRHLGVVRFLSSSPAPEWELLEDRSRWVFCLFSSVPWGKSFLMNHTESLVMLIITFITCILCVRHCVWHLYTLFHLISCLPYIIKTVFTPMLLIRKLKLRKTK